MYFDLSESKDTTCCLGAGSYSIVESKTLLAEAASRSSSSSDEFSPSCDEGKGPFFPLNVVRRTRDTGSATEAGMFNRPHTR